MLHVTSTTLELGQSTDIKGLEVISETSSTSSKEGFSSVFHRQINADTQDKNSTTSSLSVDATKINPTEKASKTTFDANTEAVVSEVVSETNAGDAILTSSSDTESQVGDELKPNVTNSILKNIQPDTILTEQDANAVIPKVSASKGSDGANEAEQEYSKELIHLLTQSEKILPSIPATANNSHEDSEAVIANVDDINNQGILTPFSNVQSLDVENDKSVIHDVTQPTVEKTTNVLSQSKVAVLESTLGSDAVLKKGTTEQVTSANVKANTVVGKEALTSAIPSTNTPKKPEEIIHNNVVASITNEGELNSDISVQNTVLNADPIQSGKLPEPVLPIDRDSAIELGVTKAQLSENISQISVPAQVKDSVERESLPISSPVQNSGKLNDTKEIKVSSAVINSAQLNDVTVKADDLVTATSGNSSQNNVIGSSLEQAKVQQTSAVFNTAQSVSSDPQSKHVNINQTPINTLNALNEEVLNVETHLTPDKTSNEVKQPNTVSQLLVDAQNGKEVSKQKVLLDGNNDKYDVDDNSELSINHSESDVTVDKTIAKASFSSLFSTHYNETTSNIDNRDSSYNERFASLQSVDGFSHKYVAENIQQVKQSVSQQIETIHINDKNFSDSVKEKVLFAISQKLQQIDIQLDPPELGNVHVRVNVQNEVAAVNFIVQQQQTKDSLEQHMDKLKDMLADSGVDVGDTNVEQQSQGEQYADNENGDVHNQGQSEGSDDSHVSEDVISGSWVKDSPAGVDFYA